MSRVFLEFSCMYRLLERIKKEFPKVQFGYFNRTKENFFPAGFEEGGTL